MYPFFKPMKKAIWSIDVNGKGSANQMESSTVHLHTCKPETKTHEHYTHVCDKDTYIHVCERTAGKTPAVVYTIAWNGQ